MTVDDGFSVLEAGRAEMGTKHSSKAIEVVRVPLARRKGDAFDKRY